MKILKSILCMAFNASLLGCLFYTFDASAENSYFEKGKNFLNNKNFLNKTKEKGEALKDKANNAKNGVKGSFSKNVNKIKNKTNKLKDLAKNKTNEFKDFTKKTKDNLTSKVNDLKNKKAKTEAQKKAEPQINKQEQEPKERSNQKISTFYVPLTLKTKSPLEISVALDILYEKLFNDQILDSNKVVHEINPSNKFNLYSLSLNEKTNNDGKQDVGLFLTPKEGQVEYLKKTIESKKFKDFIKNLNINKNSFEDTKNRLKDSIKHDEDNLQKNIDSIEKNKVPLKISHYFKEKEDVAENNKEIYNGLIKPLLNVVDKDKKLINDIDDKVKNQIFEKDFFEKSYQNSKKHVIETLKGKLGRLKSNGGLSNKFEKLKYNGHENLKVTDIKPLENRDLVDEFETNGIISYYEFSPEALIIGYFDSLGLTKEKLEEYKKYLEEKNNNFKAEKSNKNSYNEKNRKDAIKLIDQLYSKNSFLEKYEDKNIFSNTKKVAKNEENIKNYEDSLTAFKANYYSTLLNHINFKIKNQN